METPIRSKRKNFPGEFPMELVTQLLVRLPVKSIIRLMCVCKEWFSLISSPEFISLHLSRVQENDDDPPFLASYVSHGITQCMLRSSSTYKKIKGQDYHIHMPQHLEDLRIYHIVQSSVNGLVLLTKSDPWEIILWNPLIGKTHKLPPICINVSRASFGLGFNSLTNDHKVVVIVLEPQTSILIYDVKARTWRTIIGYDETIICKVEFDGVLMDGTMYWVSMNYVNSSSHIVLFDINTEEFNYVMLPSALGLFRPPIAQLNYPVIYREKLGLLHVYSTHVCLSVRENDQALESWIKLYKLDLPMDNINSIRSSFRNAFRNSFRVLNFKKNGQLMFATRNGGIKWYDFESQEVKHVMQTFPSDIDISYTTLYRESLVLL